MSVAATLERVINTPGYHDILAILKGARNGFVYGVKVRAPHAFVMSILFQSGTFQQKLRFVYKATKQHALNLAKFVSIYKTALLLQKTLNGGKRRQWDTFFAGLLGGWYVFGERNAVNEQIVLYVASRVIASFLPRAIPPAKTPTVPATASSASSAAGAASSASASATSTSGVVTPANPNGLPPPPGFPYPRSRPPHPKVFEAYAALMWGLVMYLFAERRDTLQSGMVNSMQYLYLDSEVWNSLKTLFWHNK